ncbi:MAG: prevent-host-death family protein [Planctomycetes bacterium SCN 63-9]|nr:MAG: prevent-host-death family protein [Planctomycetes bacterium SCN 63-9]
MAEKTTETPVRIIGSRELHQNLPGILKELEGTKVRYVLTVHGKPRAVLIGAEPYLNLILNGTRASEAVVGLQLSALLGGEFDTVALDDLERALETKDRES